MDIKLIAQQLKDKLSKYDDFIGLYLYGSYINGNSNINSDIDIVAIFSNNPNYDKRKSIFGDSLEYELEHDIIIDIHPMTEEELQLNYIFYEEVKKGLYYAA